MDWITIIIYWEFYKYLCFELTNNLFFFGLVPQQLKGSREGVGDNATLSNAKYHSSLQSLNNNEAPSHSHSHSTAPPHQNNYHYHPPTQESKGEFRQQ